MKDLDCLQGFRPLLPKIQFINALYKIGDRTNFAGIFITAGDRSFVENLTWFDNTSLVFACLEKVGILQAMKLLKF